MTPAYQVCGRPNFRRFRTSPPLGSAQCKNWFHGAIGRQRPAIWADAVGRSAIRSAQALLLMTLAAVVIWAPIRVPVVVIPVLLSPIPASAISPMVLWLTGTVGPGPVRY